jgi:L-amino acid N-acyltransferase YncA
LDLAVRDVTPDDAAGVVAVLNPIIAAGAFTVIDGPIRVEWERSYISRFPARGVWKVALEGERLVGFQVLEPFASFSAAFDHVASLGTYVDLSLRRRGIASALFPATFAAARQKGYEKIFTFILSGNDASLQTYLKHGFTIVGRAARQAKVAGQYLDEVMIERFL